MQNFEMGTRRFGRVNWLGLYTLVVREVRRFMVIWTQTVLGPVVTAALFLAIFALAIGPTRGEVMGVPYVEFLAPGLLMMSVIQNAFANSSSSIMSSKVQGNIVDVLMPPLSPLELLIGYLAGATGRGLAIAVVIWTGAALTLGIGMAHPLWTLLFLVLGTVLLGGLGMVGAIVSQKFDQMAAISNFIITPLSFLSGTFYSIDALPPVVQKLTHFNPIFYLIDGVRYGIIGRSDSSPVLGAGVVLIACACVLGLAWHWLRIGFRIKT